MITFQKNEENMHYQGNPRQGYTFTYIKALHSYILFGGANNDNDIHIFNISKASWSIQSTLGVKKPPSRKYHAAAFIEGLSCLLISGGEADNGKYLQDFFLLSIKDWKWRKLIIVKCPNPRERHCIYAKSEKQLILFGGISPYEQKTNDIWLMKAQFQNNKQENVNLQCLKIEPRGKIIPEGRVIAQTTYYHSNKLFVGSFQQKGDLLKLYYFDFKIYEWRQLQFNLRCTQAKIFRVIKTNHQEGFCIYFSELQKKKNSSNKFFFYDIKNNRFSKLSSQAEIVQNCDEIVGQGGQRQVLCVRQGKRLFTVKYQLEQIQQPQSSIQDYLIAIKHQQILSQELSRKNAQLEQLYRQMQNYITQLHKQYVRYEEDADVEMQRVRHIQDCHRLKKDYAKFDRLYENASEQVRGLRSQLIAVNQDFQKCMQTEFDEQA